MARKPLTPTTSVTRLTGHNNPDTAQESGTTHWTTALMRRTSPIAYGTPHKNSHPEALNRFPAPAGTATLPPSWQPPGKQQHKPPGDGHPDHRLQRRPPRRRRHRLPINPRKISPYRTPRHPRYTPGAEPEPLGGPHAHRKKGSQGPTREILLPRTPPPSAATDYRAIPLLPV